MIADDIYQEILVKPVSAGATELLIVSGYATASMAHRHLNEPAIKEAETKVQLIYGMASADGVSLVDDAMFAQLEGSGGFKCHYRIDRPAVHSKVYVWMADDAPISAFVGSANYTQRGFLGGNQQEEAMAEADPEKAFAYFQAVLSGAMEISHEDIDDHVVLFSPEQQESDADDCVTLSLVTRRGIVAARSGLNWGQRPEEGRNRNQAYLRIPSEIARMGFFPPRSTRFTVLTDDGVSFIAVTAQDGDKAIHTPDGNHILGEYFRNRLGVDPGGPVNRGDLDNYGRTDVRFCKLDEETFFMDFSV